MCLRFTTQTQKRFPLQIQEILLVHPCGLAEFPAAEDTRQLVGDLGVVVADEAALAHGIDADAQVGQHVFAGGVDVSLDRGRGVATLRHVQHFVLGLVEQVIQVHDDTVVWPKEAQGSRLFRRLSYFGEADGLEDLLQKRAGIDVLGVHVWAEVAADHLFAAPSRGDDAHAEFHQAHVRFGVRHDAVRAHGDFAATAQCQLIGCRHHGFGGSAHGHNRALQAADRAVQLLPLARLRQHADQEKIGPGAEVAALVANHQSRGVTVQTVDGRVHDLGDLHVEGVHFGVEFEEQHAVAHLHQRGTVVLFHHAAETLEIGDVDRLFVARRRFVVARSWIVGHPCAVAVGVKCVLARFEHGPHPGRSRHAFALHTIQGGGDAEQVPRFKWTQLPAETPLHGVVDVHDAVCDFGDTLRRVRKGARQRVPDQVARFVVGPCETAQPLGQGIVLDFAHAGPTRFGRGDVVDLATGGGL